MRASIVLVAPRRISFRPCGTQALILSSLVAYMAGMWVGCQELQPAGRLDLRVAHVTAAGILAPVV
jgi:hypothetical protein